MKKFVFILGGARSGKSRYAVDLAKKNKGKTVFIATAACLDAEMKERIRLHKISRPSSWKVIEEPKDISSVLCTLGKPYSTALVDCLGLWVSNLLMDEIKDRAIKKRIKELISAIFKTRVSTVIVVSNEVGGGVVPGDPLSRRFRDLVGLANQSATEKADEVIFMQAGIPVKIK